MKKAEGKTAPARARKRGNFSTRRTPDRDHGAGPVASRARKKIRSKQAPIQGASRAKNDGPGCARPVARGDDGASCRPPMAAACEGVRVPVHLVKKGAKNRGRFVYTTGK